MQSLLAIPLFPSRVYSISFSSRRLRLGGQIPDKGGVLRLGGGALRQGNQRWVLEQELLVPSRGELDAQDGARPLAHEDETHNTHKTKRGEHARLRSRGREGGVDMPGCFLNLKKTHTHT